MTPYLFQGQPQSLGENERADKKPSKCHLREKRNKSEPLKILENDLMILCCLSIFAIVIRYG